MKNEQERRRDAQLRRRRDDYQKIKDFGIRNAVVVVVVFWSAVLLIAFLVSE